METEQSTILNPSQSWLTEDPAAFIQKDSSTSFTFEVDELEYIKPHGVFLTAMEMLEKIKHPRTEWEDFSHRHDAKTRLLKSSLNGVLSAIHWAYVNHFPLQLSVSDFIIMIGQGLAKHMEVNAEKLRSHFVNFEGKETITIVREDLKLGAKNDWSTIFGQFADEIQKRVKTDLYDVIVDDTSVATKLSKIVSEITLMDAFKQYFQYMMVGGCGISKVTLVGREDDWEILRSKVKKLEELNGKSDKLKLKWWLERLVPVVEKIVDQAISKNIDKQFWRSIYRHISPGGPYFMDDKITGWINVFNPYLESSYEIFRNTFKGAHPDSFINGVSKVPFVAVDLSTNKKEDMNFLGGFLGAEQMEDGTMKTVYFYAVTTDYKEDLSKRKRPEFYQGLHETVGK